MIDDLKFELERTGLTLRKLALHIAETDRSRIPPEVLNAMLSECGLPTIAEFSSDLVAVLRDVSDKPKASKSGYAKRDTNKRLVITEDMRTELDFHLTRTNVSLFGVCRRLFPRKDTYAINGAVRNARSGLQTTLPKAVWGALIEHLREMETAREPSISQRGSVIATVIIPEADAYPERRKSITESRDDGLTPDLEPDDILPADSRPRITDYKLSKRLVGMGYIVIDDKVYQELHAQRRRTCVSSSRLLLSSPNAPPDLRDYHIARWFKGTAKSAEKHHVEWVLKTYRKIPDANKV